MANIRKMHFRYRHNFFFMLIIGFIFVGSAQVFQDDQKILINVNPDPDGNPWIAGGITESEWREQIGNLPELSIVRSSSKPPSKVDNSSLPAFRPIFDQKGGSCGQASSIGYVFTYEINTLRGLSSNTSENQYPYDFSYNFRNGGNGDNGSFPSDGFQIARDLGIPDVKTYGGFGVDKPKQWVSGYNVYYKAMTNRAKDQFTIPTNTVDGINKMKRWFFDHGNGSQKGGCLAFCYNASNDGKTISLASGTPEAGKKMMVKGGSDHGHAVSLAGYNDEVRYDYNNDKKYTNDKDITGDNKVDVRDWEIGAFIMVNSWGTSFADGGKIYVSYKFAAEHMWDQKVSGMNVGEKNYKPLLTYKVVMTHDKRDQIVIKVGYANSSSATNPEGNPRLVCDKAFNKNGGSHAMQGINNDQIEVGFDVSDFVPKLKSDVASFFLIIESKGGSGTVKKFSLLDYSGGSSSPVEISCQQENVNIQSGTVKLKIVKTMSNLMVLTPNGDEKWECDRTFPVTWQSHSKENVSIELFKDGKKNSTIIASTPGTGTYQWKIPSNQEIGDDYKIRISNVSDTKKFDESDKKFSIKEKTTLELKSPVGDEYLKKGNSVPITWNDNISSNVKIDLYRAKIFDRTIAESQPSNGSYNWNIPNGLSSGFEYTIRISSTENSWLYDESKKYFTIGYPIISAPYNQNFDSFPDTPMCCYWEHGIDNDFNWLIWKGATPSKVVSTGGGTGPNGDHTSGSGKYVYIEASSPNTPKKNANLLTPIFDVTRLKDINFSFWCHMFSRDKRMGEMWIDVNVDGIWNDSVLYLTGDHEDKWFVQNISVNKLSSQNVKRIQVRFRVKTGTGYDGDISIDDFSVNGQTAMPVNSMNAVRRKLPEMILTESFLKVRNVNGIVNIYTLNGARVMQTFVNGNQDINISILPKGIYLANGVNKYFKFVK